MAFNFQLRFSSTNNPRNLMQFLCSRITFLFFFILTFFWCGRKITKFFSLCFKVTEQVRGCFAENHPHGRVILQKCLNLYIFLKLTEQKMTWKCF